MGSARKLITTLCVAGLVLVPVAALGKSSSAPSTAGKSHGDGHCGEPKGPPSHAQGDPNRKSSDSKPKDCASSPDDDEPEPNQTSNDQESDMKSNEGSIVAALLLAMASSGAAASELGISLNGCHTTSATPGISGQRVPSPFCVGPVSDNGVEIVPQICVDDVVTPDIPGNPGGDIYCAALSSVGESALIITEATNCRAGQTGVVITRSGKASWSFDVKKNGVSQQGFPLGDSRVSGPLSLPVCYPKTQ